jgi:putative addiction module CopG family antidote
MSRIELPEEVVRQAESQVAAGRAKSIADVIRAGVDALELRDQRRYDAKLAALRDAIDAGDDSGIFDGDPFQHVRARRGLSDSSR